MILPKCYAGFIHVALTLVLLNHFTCGFLQHAPHDMYLAAASWLQPDLACCQVQAPEQAPGWTGLVTQALNTRLARETE